MKTIYSIIVVLLLGISSVFAQQRQIAPKDVNIKHLETLLKLQNCEVFSFDISSLAKRDVVYNIEYFVNEYAENGKLINKFSRPTLNNFFEVKENNANVQYQAKEVSLYIYPSQNDSTTMMSFEIKDLISLPHRLKLQPLDKNNKEEKHYSYFLRPFKIKEFREGVEIPLVLYGSAWFDKNINGYRFCGESELEADTSSEILRDMPHYFVIGVRFVATDKKEQTTNFL